MGHSDIGVAKKIYAPDVRGLNERAVQSLENYVAPEVTLPEVLNGQAELITPQPFEVVQTGHISKCPNELKSNIAPSRELQNRRFCEPL